MLQFTTLDIISLSIGLVAVVLAIAALVGQRRRRLEGLKPRLSVKLSWVVTKDAPNGTLRLDVWNAGRPPVYLKKAQMMWGQENRETRETVSKLGFIPYDAAQGIPLASTPEDALYECEGRTFILPPLPPSMMQRAANQPEDHIRIAIETPDGEIERIAGSRILPMLQSYLPDGLKVES